MSTTSRRRTQAERSEETRAKLLDATIECLVERGYTGTTTAEVARRAGLSRGAQVHHYPTKADLVAAALEHLADRRLEEALAAAEHMDWSGDAIGPVVDLLWEQCSGPLFWAAMELWIAARSDEELAERLIPVERKLNRDVRLQVSLLLGNPEDGELLVEVAVNAMIGLGLQRVLRSSAQKQDEIVGKIKSLLRTAMLGPGHKTV